MASALQELRSLGMASWAGAYLPLADVGSAHYAVLTRFPTRGRLVQRFFGGDAKAVVDK